MLYAYQILNCNGNNNVFKYTVNSLTKRSCQTYKTPSDGKSSIFIQLPVVYIGIIQFCLVVNFWINVLLV